MVCDHCVDGLRLLIQQFNGVIATIANIIARTNMGLMTFYKLGLTKWTMVLHDILL
ncbi:hypothetical protein JCM19240_2277 [Vibrio maritimus]|uniref:Uncharacterized protein n=1 Tax=Vibrio maritimus TaxID=990268 RepID=A0A090T0X6_9VIBR|nr:hypothetical protein JCM19240_2277 [Vibrio maritimus]